MTKDNEKATLSDHKVQVGDVVQWNGGLLYIVLEDKFLMSNVSFRTTNYKSWWDISTQFTVVSRAEPEPSFVVGDKVKITSDFCGGDFYAMTLDKPYSVVDVDGNVVYIVNDLGKNEGFHKENFTALPKTEANIIVAGNTYTTYNEGEWHCIYTTDEHAYMIADEGATAYVWTLDGVAGSLKSDNDYDVNWGPIEKEGVSIDRGVLTIGGLDWFVGRGMKEGSLNLTITTVDGVPDWNTISVKAREV